jgi:hypothetical protein
MKYLIPIYSGLLTHNQRDLAVTWYNENINFYHPYSVKQLAKLLGITETKITTMEHTDDEKFLTA